MQTRCIEAVSAGYLLDLASTASYQVHSRFEHVLNLRAPQGGLFSLLHPRYADQPTALRVSTPLGWDWRLQSGSQVSMRNGILHGGSWQISTAATPVWRPASPSRADPEQCFLAYPLLELLLVNRGKTTGNYSKLSLLPGWPGHCIEIEPDSSPIWLRMQLKSLIGFGNGLTPDGDDYLSGYIAALWQWNKKPYIHRHLQDIKSATLRLLHRTNDISAHYLQLALSGHYSRLLCDLSLSIQQYQQSDNLLNPHAEALMAMGASSGMDTLAGYLHGIRSLHYFVAGSALKHQAIPPFLYRPKNEHRI